MSAYNFVGSRTNFTKVDQTLPVEVARRLGDQVDTNFTRCAPYKIREGKNVQNSARFLTTFEFDCEYLRNTWTGRKSE